jgi:hypothetical protein
VIGADDGGSMFRRKIRRDFSRNRARLFFPGAQSTAERVDYAPLHFVHDLLGKIFKPERARVIGQLMSKRL